MLSTLIVLYCWLQTLQFVVRKKLTAHQCAGGGKDTHYFINEAPGALYKYHSCFPAIFKTYVHGDTVKITVSKIRLIMERYSCRNLMKVLMVNITMKVKGDRTLGIHTFKKLLSITLARLISLTIFENNASIAVNVSYEECSFQYSVQTEA
jgi:hypothetical protein